MYTRRNLDARLRQHDAFLHLLIGPTELSESRRMLVGHMADAEHHLFTS